MTNATHLSDEAISLLADTEAFCEYEGFAERKEIISSCTVQDMHTLELGAGEKEELFIVPSHNWDYADSNVCHEYINLEQVKCIEGGWGGPCASIMKRIDPSKTAYIIASYYEEDPSQEIWISN